MPPPGLLKNLFKAMIVAALFAIMPVVASVDECIKALEPANQHLESIQLDLELIVSKSQYQKSIEARYDIVRALLDISSDCLKNANLDQKLVSEWKRLNIILTALQANARECVFTKFENWMIARENDLKVMQNTKNNNSKI